MPPKQYIPLDAFGAAFFLALGKDLNMSYRILPSIADWSSGWNSNFFCAVMNIGQRL